MRFKKLVHDVTTRFFYRGVHVILHSSFVNLQSFVTTGRKLHETLRVPIRCKVSRIWSKLSWSKIKLRIFDWLFQYLFSARIIEILSKITSFIFFRISDELYLDRQLIKFIYLFLLYKWNYIVILFFSLIYLSLFNVQRRRTLQFYIFRIIFIISFYRYIFFAIPLLILLFYSFFLTIFYFILFFFNYISCSLPLLTVENFIFDRNMYIV